MNFSLSPQALSAIRRNISASLADTFQMMFQMDIFLMPKFQKEEDEQLICSYMELSYQGTKACMTLAVTRMLVEYMSDQLEPGVSPHAPTIMQDIVCEVTNIVGNHLRSYLSDKMGVEFEISLPKHGHPPSDASPHMFNLHFRIRENDSINLDFTYASPQDRIAV